MARRKLSDPSSRSLGWDHPQCQDFVAFLRLRNISAGVITRYARVLGRLFEDAGLGENAPSSITAEQLRAYLTKVQERGLAPRTISGYVLAIKRFFGFLLQEGYVTQDPSRRLPQPKLDKKLPRALSISEIQLLFGVMDDRTRLGRRDKVFFQLSYAAGLRINEATHLRVEGLDWIEGSVRVIGKGDKERNIFIKKSLLDAIQDYVREYQIEGFLFPGQNNDPVSSEYMRKRFKRYVKAAGITKPATPHWLRHSIAVHYLMGGAPLPFVQSFLGHENLATTGIYTRLTDPMTKEIALRIPTAVDTVEGKRKERRLKEDRLGYEGDAVYWSQFVRYVLDWPAQTERS